MTPRELERLEKDSIFTMRVSSDLKDQVINGYLNELNRLVKKEVRQKSLLVLIIEDKKS